MIILKFHNRLRYYRERNALSQEDLARHSGVSKVTISRIESDRTVLPHPRTRQKLAQALCIEVYKIFQPVKSRHE